jgi:hypothetical protein
MLLASCAGKRSACKTSVMEAPPSVLLWCGGVPGAEENEDSTRKFERRPWTGGPPAVLLPLPLLRPDPRIIVPRFDIDDIGLGFGVVVARLVLVLVLVMLVPLAPSLSLSLPLSTPGECVCGVERWPIAVARFTDMTRTGRVNHPNHPRVTRNEIQTKCLYLFVSICVYPKVVHSLMLKLITPAKVFALPPATCWEARPSLSPRSRSSNEPDNLATRPYIKFNNRNCSDALHR